MAHDARAFVRESPTLASLPIIYTRLTEAIDNPRASTAQIADIIASDSALTARLLRLVNSAFYAFSSRIDTVQQAVLLIGTQPIRDLALATSVFSVFPGIPRELVSMQSFWEHSITTGVTARLLATYRNERRAERFFVAGILHEIGRLLLFALRPDAARVALARSRTDGEPLIVAEHAEFGFDHAEAGGAILEAWKLPEDLQAIVRCHHAPAEAGHFQRDAALVHVADVIATAMKIGNSGDPAVPALAPDAWEQLELAPTILSALTDEVERQVYEVARSMLTTAMR
jgi:HD-like signal output (HDOD) protein